MTGKYYFLKKRTALIPIHYRTYQWYMQFRDMKVLRDSASTVVIQQCANQQAT